MRIDANIIRGNMMIRLAIKDDAPRILVLLQEILRYHKELYPDRFKWESKYGIKEIETLIDKKFIYVYDDMTIKGYVIGWQEGDVFFVDDLCVDSEYRSQSIGTQLMHYIIEQAKSNHLLAVDLNVWSKNIGAMKFYMNLGFETLKYTLTYKL